MSAVSVDYDGRRFRPVEGPAGDRPAGQVPTAHWSQRGDVVLAEFGGGHVRAGWLVGTSDPDGVVDAAYCQLLTDGTVQAGRCVSTPSLLADGRLRLEERWRRCDGSAGVSWIEEVR
jgi:hypothetical protein